MQPSTPHLKNKLLTLLLPLIMAVMICAGSVPDIFASIAAHPAPAKKSTLGAKKHGDRVVYYPGTFEPLALIDGDGQVYYYHNDLNGLPQELTRPNGEIVWSASYDALGRMDQILVNEVAQPLRMQGQYWDEEVGLCYNRHRYFDPKIGAFISQDPLGLAAGENVYAYAPNVWGWVDPLGLACEHASTRISNPVPDRMARVIPGEGPYPKLGPPGRSDVFVTAADDIAGMNAEQISQRLTINPNKKFTVIEFDTPSSGVASPINRSDPGFIGGGRTAGGAREFVIPNQSVPSGSIVRIVQ